MRALITNDDGIGSAGLRMLAHVAIEAGLKVTVAAPHAQRSGSSAALSALEPGGRLLLEDYALPGLDGVPAFAVQASPALVVFAATGGAFGPCPDIVLSGINIGPNTGQAVLHSGTVGAALTAASHGIPAMAISLASAAPAHWDAAGAAAARVLRWFMPRATEPVVVNVNLPDLPASELRGLRPARLAAFGAVQAQVKADDSEPASGSIALTFARPAGTADPDSDLALLRQGWATVTVLRGLCASDALDLSALG
ncbi:MAG: 5'/3'-nucleotidase SurE [Streptosporangiaceae bacterium]